MVQEKVHQIGEIYPIEKKKVIYDSIPEIHKNGIYKKYKRTEKIKKSGKLIIQFLLKSNIPFIDVGLGVNAVDDTLIGTVRVTTGTHEKNNHLVDRIPFVDEGNFLPANSLP